MLPSSNSEPEPLRARLDEVDRRARLVRAFLVVLLIVLAAKLASSLLQLRLLAQVEEGMLLTEQQIAANDTREQVLGVSVLVAFGAVAAVFLWWKVAAYRLLSAFVPFGTEHTPGWAAGAYFVPILNLFRPYQIMREIWDGSEHTAPTLEQEGDSHTLLGIWWALWLLSGFAGRLSNRLFGDAQTVEQFQTATAVNVAVTVLFLASAVAALLVVQCVNGRQQAQGEDVLTGAAVIPPVVTEPDASF
jgi:hypothetical protein